jgi:nucleotide-binding universal stress UspA family protein
MATAEHSGPLGDVKSILLATDFSEASKKPLHYAAAVARHYGARLYLTHVVHPSLLALVDPDAREATSEAVCNQAEDFLRDPALDNVSHELVLRKGEIWGELEKTIEEKKVDLVVVGTRGRKGIKKLILGSVAEQIFRHASCPVLTVGPGSAEDPSLGDMEGIRSVLLATDLETTSPRALEHAISFATRHKAKLVLLHVMLEVQVPEKFSNCWIHGSDTTRWRKDAELTSLRKMGELVSGTNGLPFAPEFVVEWGLTAESIQRTAKRFHSDLIVMGLKPSAHITSASHLPWTTAHAVACSSTCPVLTTRDRQ